MWNVLQKDYLEKLAFTYFYRIHITYFTGKVYDSIQKKIKLKKWKWIIKKPRKIKTVTRKIKRKKTNEEQFLIINDNKLLLSNRFSSNISLLVKSSFLDILISLSIWEFYCWHFILLVNVLLVCCVVALFNMQLYQIICAQKHGWQNISTYKIKQKTVSIGVTFN